VEKAELQLQIEQLRRQVAWRHVNLDKFLAALHEKTRPAGVTILYLRDDPDVWNLSQEFYRALTEAGWKVSYPEPIQANDSPLFGGLPSVAGVGGSAVSGIALVANDFKVPTWTENSPFSALATAVMKGVGVQVALNKPLPEQGTLPPGVIRIVIGPKMDPVMTAAQRGVSQNQKSIPH
jgi:hypothetical protein